MVLVRKFYLNYTMESQRKRFPQVDVVPESSVILGTDMFTENVLASKMATSIENTNTPPALILPPTHSTILVITHLANPNTLELHKSLAHYICITLVQGPLMGRGWHKIIGRMAS